MTTESTAPAKPTVPSQGDATPPPAAPPAAARPRRGGRVAHQVQRFSLVFFLIAGFVVFAGLRPDTFPTKSTMLTMLASQSVVVILALAVSLTLRLGDLDVSFGAAMATSSVLVAVLNANHHWPIGWAIVAGLVFGLLVGALNALLVVVIGLNSFVATLGTMTVLEGIGYALSNSQVVAGVSEGFANDMQGGPGGVPLAAILGWALAVVMWVLYEYTPFGRYLIFIGGNARAAALLGLRVSAVRIAAYMASGLLFGAAGVVLTGTLGSADPSTGAQYLLPPLAAAFLGTTAVQIGRFNVVGTIIGVYTLAILSTGLLSLGVSAWIVDVFNGAALILALSVARFAPRGRRPASS